MAFLLVVSPTSVFGIASADQLILVLDLHLILADVPCLVQCRGDTARTLARSRGCAARSGVPTLGVYGFTRYVEYYASLGNRKVEVGKAYAFNCVSRYVILV